MRKTSLDKQFYIKDMQLLVKDLYTKIEVYWKLSSSTYITYVYIGNRRTKPNELRNFKTFEEVNDFANKYISKYGQVLNIKQEHKNLQKEQNIIKAQEVKIGDIFRYAWGYSMSGNNFYQVIARKGARVTLQRINSEYVIGDWMGGHVKPIKDSFGSEKITKLLKGDRVKIDHNAYAQKCNPEDSFYENHLD